MIRRKLPANERETPRRATVALKAVPRLEEGDNDNGKTTALLARQLPATVGDLANDHRVERQFPAVEGDVSISPQLAPP